MSGLTFFLPKVTLGRTGGGGGGWGGGYHLHSEVFFIFFLHDKTSASDILSSYLFIPARF